MSYRDPYADSRGERNQYPAYDTQYSYGGHQATQGGYNNNHFDPYAGGYRDEPTNQSGAYDAIGSVTRKPTTKERSIFEDKDEPFTPPQRRPTRSAATVRSWRYEHQGDNLWTSGGRGRCIGRFCCCSAMTAVFLIASIIGALALWARPPNVIVGQVQTSDSTLQQTSGGGFGVNLSVNISVDNPNFFSVSFKEAELNLTYPINNTPIGGGDVKDITFHSHSNKTFTFPVTLEYNPSSDPSGAVLADLVSKCGVGGSKSDITVNYKITLRLKILFVTISPAVSNSFKFVCPVNLGNLGGLLGGSL